MPTAKPQPVMELKDIPIEMLDAILGHLFEYEDHWDETGDENTTNFTNARLVCRQWNALASRHLFHTVHLQHGAQHFATWNSMMDSETVRLSARRARINSSPIPFRTRNSDWMIWEADGVYPAYTHSLSRLADLKNLTAIIFHYTKKCRTREHLLYEEDIETESTRIRNLFTFFNAVHQRALKFPDANPIRSITIENLQNLILPDLTSSDSFRKVLRDLNCLHLVAGEERNTLDSELEQDLHRPERLGFERHLRFDWVGPIAGQLTSLTLMFQGYWGVAPGKFDTSHLDFPRLRILHLGGYVIAHHNQFDWVLRQKGLEILRLDKCAIGSHLRFNNGLRQKWGINNTDWVPLPKGSYGFDDEDDEIYIFDGTWEAVFDSIRERMLPGLLDFRFDYTPGETFLHRPDLMGNLEPHVGRYCAFDTGWCEGWLANEGPMAFGDNNPSPIPPGPRIRYLPLEHELDRGRETHEEDRRGLENLVGAIKKSGLAK